MLHAVYLHEDFVDVKGIAIATVSSPKSARINGSEFYTPEADCLSRYSDALPGQKFFDIAVGEIESMVEPNNIGNNVGRESGALIVIQHQIGQERRLTCQYLMDRAYQFGSVKLVLPNESY